MIDDSILDNYIKKYPEYEKAIEKRNKFKGDLIAITGSCGKTTTTSMIFNVLHTKYSLNEAPENANGFKGIGINFANIFNVQKKYWIQEIGIDHYNEMLVKLALTKPSIYVLTNIYEAHTGNFKNITDYHNEKLNFIYYALPNSTIILNNDNIIIKNHLEKNIEHYKSKNIKLIYCGTNINDDVQLVDYKLNDDNISSIYFIKIKNSIEFQIKLNYIGKHYGENACLAIACGILCNVPLQFIKESFNNLTCNTSRGIISNINNLILYDYSYNMIYKACFNNLNEFKKIKSNNKIIIIGKFDSKEINHINNFNSIIILALSITNNVNIFTYYKDTIKEIYNKNTNNKKRVNIFNKPSNLIEYINNLNKTTKWYVFVQTPSFMKTFKDIILPLKNNYI
jgi:UDP-N-acetylmuramyl pentapeptide synthase